MRSSGYPLLDVTSVLDCGEDFAGAMPQYSGDSHSAFWVIRNPGAGKANGFFYFDNITLKPEKETTARIALKGILNSDVIQRLNKIVKSRMLASVQTWIVDLSKADFISMEGTVGLFETSRALEHRGAKLLLANLPKQILRVFRVWNALPATQVFGGRREMKDYLTAMQKEFLEEQHQLDGR